MLRLLARFISAMTSAFLLLRSAAGLSAFLARAVFFPGSTFLAGAEQDGKRARAVVIERPRLMISVKAQPRYATSE